jgi:drug/metabolite transporter (DMT)-like permease
MWTVTAFLIALSVASERLVEIIKGLIPVLHQRKNDPRQEGRRAAALQFIAVLSGMVTSLLAWPAAKNILPAGWTSLPGILALGLLASGGSGFWNSVLTYVTRVKDIKRLEVSQRSSETRDG